MQLTGLERWEEVQQGIIIPMEPKPLEPHQILTHNIVDYLKDQLKATPYKIYGSGVGVSLSEDDNFVPDAMVITDLSVLNDESVEGAPTFVAEVLSPLTEVYDRGYKKEAYEKQGVGELWLVGLETQSIEVYHLINGRYVLDRIARLYSEAFIQALPETERPDIDQNPTITLLAPLEVSVPLRTLFER